MPGVSCLLDRSEGIGGQGWVGGELGRAVRGHTEQLDLPAGPEHPSIQSGYTGADGLTDTRLCVECVKRKTNRGLLYNKYNFIGTTVFLRYK